MSRRILLLVPTTTYKAEAFLAAAERLRVDVVVASDSRQALEAAVPGTTLALPFARPERAVQRVVEFAGRYPLAAVIGADDETTPLAARLGQALGLPHNPLAAVQATRDKHALRRALAAAGLRGPRFRRVALTESPARLSEQVDYPCVLKPLALSASRGVLRVDDAPGLVAAFERLRRLLQDREVRRRGDAEHLLIEDYLPGVEVAVEGRLREGRLQLLALFDKPDPLEGPTFEESMFVTPSRLPAEVCRAIADETQRACDALGLIQGPIHAELRVHQGVPTMLEVAARTIGGLCSRALRFGAEMSLEELVLRDALGQSLDDVVRESGASGVLMIPIPRPGVLGEVRGIETALAVEGVVELKLTLHRGAEVVPLPEGHRYLGFIFARADRPQQVEAALRRAHAALDIDIA